MPRNASFSLQPHLDLLRKKASFKISSPARLPGAPSSHIRKIQRSFALSFFQIILVLTNQEARGGLTRTAWRYITPRGLFSTLAGILQMYALPYAPVAYILALKRTSVFWGILWGIVLFKERVLPERLVGAVMTFIGMCLILFGG